ncbi:MAG: hypothetical protein KBS42_02715 [Bacteroidales bacterium]|nr:hypothetical protein [Candidatus Colicola coprequi]
MIIHSPFSILHSQFSILLFAFCILHFAFCFSLPAWSNTPYSGNTQFGGDARFYNASDSRYRLFEVSGNIPSQGWGEPMPMQPTSATFSSQSGHGYLRHAYTLPVSAMSLGSGVSAEEALSTASQYRRVGPRRALGDGDEDEGPGFDPANPGSDSPIGSPILPLLLLTIVYAVSKWRIQKSAKND